MSSLVTYDFHNTIASCDEWFSLEIRDLPLRTIEILAPEALERHAPETIVATYRELRKAVMASGKEVDAVEGVLRVATAFDVVLDRDEVDVTVAQLMHAAAEHATPISGAVEGIRELAARGITIGVVSSAVYHPFLEWTLERFGVAEDLGFIMTSASSGYYKSDPEIYRAAMRQAGSDVAHSIHVGDSEKWDVWSAKEAGMRAVWFRNGSADTLVDRSIDVKPDYTVTSMEEVAPWVIEALGADR